MNRGFYLIDTEQALAAAQRMSLAAIGGMATLCGLVYCEGKDLPADDDHAVAGMLFCSVEEWVLIKAELLALGDIVVSEGLVLPSAAWAKPVSDS